MKVTRIEFLWREIRQESIGCRIPDGEFRLVRIDPEYPFEIYAGLDSKGFVMLAVGVSSRPPVIDADSGALNYLRSQRASGTWIMALRLTIPGLEQVFGQLCQDLIDSAVHVTTETALVTLFRERLLLWKQLFLDSGAGLLQKFQIKGLVAELLALESFIDHFQEDPLLPVASWVGPTGADQDFLFADRALEIKAISPTAQKVNISSANQLFASVPLELCIYVLRESSTSETKAVSLPLLVSRIEERLVDYSTTLLTFRSKLIEAGYVEHDYYRGVAFTLMETRRYSVTDEFPKLIGPKLPDAITDVTYGLLLDAISTFRIPENSDAN